MYQGRFYVRQDLQKATCPVGGGGGGGGGGGYILKLWGAFYGKKPVPFGAFERCIWGTGSLFCMAVIVHPSRSTFIIVIDKLLRILKSSGKFKVFPPHNAKNFPDKLLEKE